MNKTDKICRTDEFVISKVPLDIIYKICQFMNIVDICKFRRINKIIFYNITLIQYDLLSYQLKLQCDFTNCNYFHNWLNTYLSRHLYQYKRMFYKDYHFLHKKRTLQFYITNFNKHRDISFIPPISSYHITNSLFDIIFTYYINNNFCNIDIFPNKLLLLTFYNFLKLEYYTDSNYCDFNYRFNFLEQNDIANIDNLKIHYYHSVLYKFHYKNYIPMTFNQMCTISNYVTSIPVIKKILGYKALNLSNTVLNLCCYDCNENYLIEICNIKRYFWKDDLISHNYTQFKQMLKRTNLYYYNILCNRETIIINSMIYIKNPITNRRVRVDKTIYNNLIYDLDEYKVQKLTNHISNQKNYFRNKFFT